MKQVTDQAITELEDIFDPGTTVFAGAAFTCMLTKAGHHADAARLSLAAFESARQSADKILYGGGIALPASELLMLTEALGNHAGFRSRLDWLLALIQQDPHPGSRIASLSYTGRGLAWIGRRKLAEEVFQTARDQAIAQPLVTSEGPERFAYLLTALQFAAEAELWDLAGEYFLETEQVGAELLKRSHPSFSPADIRKGLDYFRDAIRNRRFSKPAPLLESKKPSTWR